MVRVEKVYDSFIEHGIDFFIGVPDSLLKDICAYITDHTKKDKHIIAANEGIAIAIAAGYHMASANIPFVYMQNSGIGNAINPLLSLMDDKVYKLPALLVVGWRGEPGVKDEPQHVKQGEVTLSLFDTMKIPYTILDTSEDTALSQIRDVIFSIKSKNTPHALIIKKDTFTKYELRNKVLNNYELSREDALKIVVNNLDEKSIVVSTTGKLSRELFEYREVLKHGHKRDFLTVGSMGHSSSIALGIALEKEKRTVFCLDGDGAFIMHMGALSNIGSIKPRNCRHIVFNNGAHESVGGQATIAFQLDIPMIAKSCGYSAVYVAESENGIINALKEMERISGPALLEIKCCIASRDDLGRPTIAPIENKIDFMNNLKG